MFKKLLKRCGLRFASGANLHYMRHTPPQSVRNFVRRLAPLDLGVPLIRLGGTSDGGYLIPDDLEGIRYCFSPGVADLVAFERALLDLGIPSFLADYSVDGPPCDLPGCDFLKRFVGPVNDSKTITLDEWLQEALPAPEKNDLILQMDIEGAEYLTLLATSPDILSRFRIIALEIHNLGHLNHPIFFQLADSVIRKLLDLFEIAHIHPNNAAGSVPLAGIDIPRVLELTLLRKDRVLRRAPISCLPHELDEPNVPDLPDIYLNEIWWSKHRTEYGS